MAQLGALRPVARSVVHDAVPMVMIPAVRSRHFTRVPPGIGRRSLPLEVGLGSELLCDSSASSKGRPAGARGGLMRFHPIHRPISALPLLLALAALTGCPECAPERVGEGIARLTVRNVGAMVTLVNDDRRCGFASQDVLSNARFEGEPGGAGTATFTVDACEIDLGESRLIREDCNGVRTRASGKVTISATRTVTGTLTGNPQNPIIPDNPDAVTIRISEAVFDDFEVVRSDSDRRLRMISGKLSATARPLLAASASSGVCAIATPNVAFTNISYDEESTVFIRTKDNAFEADVSESSFHAQSGRRGDVENTIRGTMTVFGTDVDVIGDEVLDDTYERGTFAASYACLEDISDPVSFECVDLRTRLVDSAARLGVVTIGTLASILDQDEECGFASDKALQTASVNAAPGTRGRLTLTVTDCELDFGETLTLPPDCAGVSRTIDGRVVVSGTKIVEGLITADPLVPIIPLSAQPVTLQIEAEVEELRVGTTRDDNALFVESGVMSGTVRPKLFIGADTGVCSVASPNADFADVRFADAALLIISPTGSFDVAVDEASLSATSGITDLGENLLRGTVTVDGQSRAVPSDDRGLDPSFDAARFEESYSCSRAFATPLSDRCEEAAFEVIATGVGALTMRALGVIANFIEAETTCGFSSAGVAGAPTLAPGSDGQVIATTSLAAGGCVLTLPEDTLVHTDCLGNTTTMGGRVVVSGTRTVTGVPTGIPENPLLPTSTDAIRYELQLDFTEVEIQSSASPAYLIVHEGLLSAIIEPRLALDPLTETCVLPTPILTFTDVRWSDADVTMVQGASSVRVLIESTDFDAQAGSGVNEVNTLRGVVKMLDGSVLIDGPLDPAFQAEAFSATWNCAEAGSPVLVDDARCRAGVDPAAE
jgi:hypothetical protein